MFRIGLVLGLRKGLWLVFGVKLKVGFLINVMVSVRVRVRVWVRSNFEVYI